MHQEPATIAIPGAVDHQKAEGRYPMTSRSSGRTDRYSGIRDWLAFLQFSRSDEDALALVLRQPALTFPPGEEWAYSDGNYLLAKVLAERVSGASFNDFPQARMFGPLGMTSTMYGADVRAAENHAKAYEPQGAAGARR